MDHCLTIAETPSPSQSDGEFLHSQLMNSVMSVGTMIPASVTLLTSPIPTSCITGLERLLLRIGLQYPASSPLLLENLLRVAKSPHSLG